MVHRRPVYIYLFNVPSFSSRHFNKIKRTSRLGRLLALSLEILCVIASCVVPCQRPLRNPLWSNLSACVHDSQPHPSCTNWTNCWFKEQPSILCSANVYRYTGNPLKRVIFHFPQMSTFLQLKLPFSSAQLFSQSAQTSLAVSTDTLILIRCTLSRKNWRQWANSLTVISLFNLIVRLANDVCFCFKDVY